MGELGLRPAGPKHERSRSEHYESVGDTPEGKTPLKTKWGSKKQPTNVVMGEVDLFIGFVVPLLEHP